MGLYDVCTKPIWNQLNVWKYLVNKISKNSNKKQRLKYFKIFLSSDKQHSGKIDSRRDDYKYNEKFKCKRRGKTCRVLPRVCKASVELRTSPYIHVQKAAQNFT